MAADRIGTEIEDLIQRGDWKSAQDLIEK